MDSGEVSAWDGCVAAFDALPTGTDGTTSGNSQACRVYHLGAAQTDAATHCPHASADGGGVCVESFCDAFQVRAV